MRLFLVTFLKVVCDDTGHERRALQDQIVVPAPSSDAAITAGQTLFCEANGVVDWRLRADACEAAEIREGLGVTACGTRATRWQGI